jgi:2-polyprenyl-3-methyl-5-hydroxy-6-metoxy-1,4-benzoquinol methylase
MALAEIVDLIGKKNQLQRKYLKKYLEGCSKEFISKSEAHLAKYLAFLEAKDIGLDFVADSYLSMVNDICLEQTNFRKTGKYRYDNLRQVNDKVYNNTQYMVRYMIGVALSQFLWRNHREMFLFFKKNTVKVKGKNYLEVGPGHGLFFMEVVRSNNFTNYHAIDISETSLEITKSFINFCIDAKNLNIEFFLADINDKTLNMHYDFITMGEVLEHVEDPKKLLKSIYSLLSDNGQAYISSCANAPVIDHIYLYSSVDEIRGDIRQAGLEIIDELVISIDGIDEQDWVSKKANLSYACIAKKAHKADV